MNDSNSSRSAISFALFLVALVLLMRLSLLSTPDLIDSTEGRYASVSKIMFESGDLVTPWINRSGVLMPYLGKPPLHFWMTDLSFTAFGLGNWAARLPSFISGVGTVLITFLAAYALFDLAVAAATLLILTSSLLFFFLSGACVLDVTLTFAITCATAGFVLCPGSRLWGFVCFGGLGLGMLAKGPVAIVLFGGIALPWSLLRWRQLRRLPEQLTALPWLYGMALFLLLTLPWYFVQEYQQAGFLRYFFINENLLRYVSAEYGDKYGAGHIEPRGMSWIMLTWGFFPWSLIALAGALWGLRPRTATLARDALRSSPELCFVLAWGFACPTFFTFAKQLTATYLLPALPGLSIALGAILVGQLSSTQGFRERMIKTSKFVTPFFGGMLLIGSLAGIIRFQTPIIVGLIAFSVGALLTWLTYRERANLVYASRDASPLSQIVRVSGVTAVAFGLAILCYGPYASVDRSSATILAQAREYAPEKHLLTVGFAYDYPFSSNFYDTIPGQRPIAIVKIEPEELGTKKVDLLVVRVRDRQKLLDGEVGWVELVTIGRWALFEMPTSRISSNH